MRKHKVIVALYRICICVFIVSSAVAVFLCYQMFSANREFATLRQKASMKEEGTHTQSHVGNPRIDKYAALHHENEDLAGWITIEGTNIDYPVMWTPKEPEYYLKKSFSKEYSYSGTPFVGEGCSLKPRTQNVIIYGHNMLNKTMFSDLIRYSFYGLHPVIQFDTLDQSDLYEIISVFPTSVEPNETGAFRFYEHIDFRHVEEFEEWRRNIRELSLYEIDSEFGFEDEFLTLSTCSYHTENGRFVVIAKKSCVAFHT